MVEFPRSLFSFHKKSAPSTSDTNPSAQILRSPSTTHLQQVPKAVCTSETVNVSGEIIHGKRQSRDRLQELDLKKKSNVSTPTVSQPTSSKSSLNSTTMNFGQIQEKTPHVGLEESTSSKAKLVAKIVAARNLQAAPNCRPYVVCTFGTSEFITETGDSDPNDVPMGGTAVAHGVDIAPKKPITASGHTVGSINPTWKEETVFDVTARDASELVISVYDGANHDAFLGHVRISTILGPGKVLDAWYVLENRVEGEHVNGEVRVQAYYEDTVRTKMGPEDFEILRLIGKGTFGQVYQVRKKDTKRIYAMKVLSKKVVVQKKEIAHTIGERDILVRTSTTQSPFIVGLKFSFQTEADLYFVTDYMSGGELFWHLQREGRFSEQRAKFYIAELVIALEHLHDNNIVYRDLKPENILLDANGHIALCDFGLSKANVTQGDTTSTFCGTTEYLAPEVLLDESGYTKMVDFWSLGVLIFEMCCGWSPFHADDTQQMYKNIAFGKVKFPKDALSAEGRSFVKGLLNRNPENRLGAQDDARELRRHPFFHDIDWDALVQKKIPPPFKPHVASETDTSNFDPEFTEASTSLFKSMKVGTPLSPRIQDNFVGFTFVGESSMDEHFKHRPTSRPVETVDEDMMESDNEDEDMGDEEMFSGRFEM
ncbi:Serine/threonine-protein kinase SCH9 [Yarrowia sp. B02]|nr:Serine/threonine-protein kinase SCH9 [Yarrowia sp. B02]